MISNQHKVNSEPNSENSSNFHNSKNPETAATKIQSAFRGYLARKKFKAEKTLFEGAKLYINDPEKLRKFKLYGPQNPVYVLEDLPLVIKESSSKKIKVRFEKMEAAKKICAQNNYSYLTIPNARLHGSFLIENRLPIYTYKGIKAQIGFYLAHLEQITPAVKNFTGFLCQGFLGDIIEHRSLGVDPYPSLSSEPNYMSRPDNVAMYFEEREGCGKVKIALLDLEEFFPLSKKTNQKLCVSQACDAAVTFFPHHLEVILKEAKQFYPKIEKYRKDVEDKQKVVLEYFEKVYGNHLAIVKQNNIDPANPTKFPTISPTRRKEIEEVLIHKMQEKSTTKKFNPVEFHLGDNPKQTLEKFKEEEFPAIFDGCIKMITDLLEESVDNYSKSTAISSYPLLLDARTLMFDRDCDIYISIKQSIVNTLSTLTIKGDRQKKEIADFLIHEILIELQNGKEIAWYNPVFGFGAYATSCIFC